VSYKRVDLRFFRLVFQNLLELRHGVADVALLKEGCAKHYASFEVARFEFECLLEL
jgi:hypothetical protein